MPTSRTLKILALLLPLSACVQTPAPVPQTQPPTMPFRGSTMPFHGSNDVIVQNFDIVGFGNKYTQRRHNHVRKWKMPIRVGIQSFTYAPFLEKIVSEHTRILKELTGHPIELYDPATSPQGNASDSRKVNFILYYYPPSEIFGKIGKYFHNDPDLVQYMLDDSTCFSKIFTRNKEIVAGLIVLPSNNPVDHIRACVTDQMTLSLGLPNNSELVRHSVFNDGNSNNSLSEHDKWMLRMFFDPRITAGMPRQEAIAMGRRILSEIRPEGN